MRGVMIVRAIDFQGVHGLTRNLVEQLRHFLDAKEGQLADSILHSITLPPGQFSPPVLASTGHQRLSQVCDTFRKRMREISDEQIQKIGWKTSAAQINQALWSYVNILKGNVRELFSQVEQAGFERWNGEFFTTVESLKELLLNRIDDLIWTIKHIDDSLYKLKSLYLKYTGSLFQRISNKFSPILDRSLISQLKSSEEYLKTQFKQFRDKYHSYQELDHQVESSMREFQVFPCWKMLDQETKEKFTKIYRLVKVWEENQKRKIFPAKEILKPIKLLTPPGKALLVFKEYLGMIKDTLFDLSRKNKQTPLNPETQKEKIEQIQQETKTLGSVIGKYRDLLLSYESQSKLKGSLGFSDWLMKQEPKKTKDLLTLMHETDLVDHLYQKFSQSLTGVAPHSTEKRRLKKEIENTLQDMEQPLSSRATLKIRIEHLLQQLEKCDEIGSSYGDMSDLISHTLNQALHIDWKHQLMNENPKFYSLYAIHKGIEGLSEDRFHLNRMHKFKQITHHLIQWVKHHDTLKHVHDVETDIHDIKESFQEFLAQIQKKEQEIGDNSEKASIEARHFSDQLLEYRFLFATFLYHIRNHGPEGKWMRDQFIFADQYFEAIQQKIDRLRKT